VLEFSITDLDNQSGFLTISQEINGQARVLNKWVGLRVRPSPRFISDRIWRKMVDRMLIVQVDKNFDRVRVT